MSSKIILPDFLVIGAMKCGTSTLRHAMHKHPEVFMVYPEEPRFFFSNKRWAQGLELYSSFFANAKEEKAIGEGSGYYSWKAFNDQTVQRIASILPDVKIIYMVRHPIERIISHWTWEVANGKYLGDIERAIKNNRYYIEMSLYYDQISAYREYFDDENIKVLFLEDLKRHPDRFYQDCFQFLNVDPMLAPGQCSQEIINKSGGRLTDSRFLIQVRALPGMKKLRQFLPHGFIQGLKPLMKTKKIPVPTWSSAFRQDLEGKIRPDSIAFLSYCKKPVDFWKF